MADRELKLIGFNLIKIEAEKNQTFDGKIKIKQDIQLKSVEKQKINLTKQESLKIEFYNEINYGELGKIAFTGNIFFLVNSKTMKEALKAWKKNRLPEQLNLIILNIIMQKSTTKAFQLQEELNLPHHIQLPRLQINKKTE